MVDHLLKLINAKEVNAKVVDVLFADQTDGYDKEQVDDYVGRLSDAYQTVYREYQSVCAKYNTLVQDYRILEKEKTLNNIDAGTLAKAVIDSGVLTTKIKETARTEADRIIDEAHAEADRLVKAAGADAARIIDKTRISIVRFQDMMARMMREAQELAADTN